MHAFLVTLVNPCDPPVRIITSNFKDQMQAVPLHDFAVEALRPSAE
jgi:hypothetical protein